MIWNKIAFFGATVVMATSVISASAAVPMSSAASAGVVQLSNSDQFTYNISATRMVRGATVIQFGQLNMFRTNNGRTGIVAAIDKLDWFGSNVCCISGRLGYQNTSARINFFLTKEAGKDYASWRILRSSDSVVLADSGKDANGELTKNLILSGGINLNAPSDISLTAQK